MKKRRASRVSREGFANDAFLFQGHSGMVGIFWVVRFLNLRKVAVFDVINSSRPKAVSHVWDLPISSLVRFRVSSIVASGGF